MSISISKRLSSLGLTYPFWLFDVDQPSWPRKLARIPPGSRPARLTGWYPWPWEYGTALFRIDDPILPGVVDTRQRDPRRLGEAARVLETLRYDDRFGEGSFEVAFEPTGANAAAATATDAGEREREREMETRGFDEWIFDEGHEGYVDPRRVVRLKRRWDGVPFWDRDDCWNLFDDGEARRYASFGMASLVHNEGELIAAAGTDQRITGEAIRKAEFEFVDGDEEMVRGIVFPKRNQVDHGLTLSRGPDFVYNREKLAGTALEGAPWSEVEDYVFDRRGSPLWLDKGSL